MADKSLPVLVSELWELIREYVKQETLEPLKGLARYIGFGVAGAFLVGLGLVELTVGLLRALQTQTGTHFRGNWSWAPYALTLVATLIVVGLLASLMGKRKATR